MEVCELSRRLKNYNSDSDVWLDSSPTCYSLLKQRWRTLGAQFTAPDETSMSDDVIGLRKGFTSATTNPRLITRAVLQNPEHWQHVIDHLAPQLSNIEKARQVYDQVIAQGAMQLCRLWVESEGRHGWLSAQVDCGARPSLETLVERATQLASLAPNIMLKIPGSANGYKAIEHLVALGYSVNNTFCFTVSQCHAGLQAISKGRARALSNGIDTKKAHYVISFMIGRLGDEQAFSDQATAQQLLLSTTERRWAELAIFEQMQALLRRESAPVRLLLCSLKLDTDAQGREQCWHLERTGSDTTLYTLTPEIVEFIQRRHRQGRPVQPAQRRADVPDSIMNKLLKLDYFTQAYFLDNQSAPRFEDHPAFATALLNALDAQHQLLRFVDAASPRQAAPFAECSQISRAVA